MRRSCLLGLLAGLVTALPATAVTPTERDAAFDALMADPANTDLALRYARIASDFGDYEGALGTLEGLLLAVGEDPNIRVELAALYLRLKSYSAARFNLDSALANGNLSPQARARAERLLAIAGSGKSSGHSVNGFASLGVRYRSNANFGPDSLTVRALGIDVPIPDVVREQDDVDGLFIGRATHSYDFGRQDALAYETSAFLFVSRQADLDDLHSTLVEVTTGPRWAPFKGGYKGLTVRPHLVANGVWRGDEFNSRVLGGGVNVRLQDEGALGVDATYQYRDRDFEGENRFADQRDGHENFFATQLRYLVAPQTVLFGRFDYIERVAAVASQQATEYGIVGGIEQRYSAPIAWSPGPWRSYLTGGYRGSEYSAADPNVDPTIIRDDDEWRVAVGQSVPITGRWRANAEIAGTFVESTITNFERDNWSATLSASYAF